MAKAKGVDGWERSSSSSTSGIPYLEKVAGTIATLPSRWFTTDPRAPEHIPLFAARIQDRVGDAVRKFAGERELTDEEVVELRVDDEHADDGGDSPRTASAWLGTSHPSQISDCRVIASRPVLYLGDAPF